MGQRENLLHTISLNEYQREKRKEMQQETNLQLFDLGVKKNGMTSGIPINPVNHQYQNTYGGKQLEAHDNLKHLNDLVRMHHLQSKNTCGYNLLNGK